MGDEGLEPHGNSAQNAENQSDSGPGSANAAIVDQFVDQSVGATGTNADLAVAVIQRLRLRELAKVAAELNDSDWARVVAFAESIQGAGDDRSEVGR